MGGALLTVGVILVSVALIVLLTLRWKIPAFLALLVVAIFAGFALGAPPATVLKAIQKGMGDTLGFVAVVVGLGALLGGLLEASGGVRRLSEVLLARVPARHAPWALALIGMIVGAPLFFEVAFVLMAPLIVGVTQGTKRSILFFATPCIMGLAMMHALIPPHPGAVAAAQLLHADFGLVLMYGLICAVPAVIVSGPIYALLAFRRGEAEPEHELTPDAEREPIARISAGEALVGMLLPVVLILGGALANALMPAGPARDLVAFLGHPFTALILACIYAWGLLVLVHRTPMSVVGPFMNRALAPAGAITLVIGGGAAFKQVLVDGGAGAHLTTLVAGAHLSPMVFGFLVAVILRIAQGSTTVAIVTAAGLVAPLAAAAGLDARHLALTAVALGAGGIVMSHVNDAGFWLIGQYLRISEARTFRGWSIACSLGGLVAFLTALGLAQLG